jgi:hypothetical protein
MKEDEILDRKKLESIDGEMFHSFDLEDALWIMGGFKTTQISTAESNGTYDYLIDFQ